MATERRFFFVLPIRIRVWFTISPLKPDALEGLPMVTAPYVSLMTEAHIFDFFKKLPGQVRLAS